MDNLNGFSATYQPMNQPNFYYQPQPNVPQPMYNTRWPQQNFNNNYPQQSNRQPVDGMKWVQGEAGAKAYTDLVPGVPTPLWDSDAPVIYIKTIDENGKPSTTILDYTERDISSKKDVSAVEYATIEQITSINESIASLKEQIEQIEHKIPAQNKNQQTQNNRRGNK